MDESTKTLLAGLGTIVLGILGWVLPYRWNPFRFSRFLARFCSDKVNEAVPKIIGSLLILLGIVLVAGSFVNR